MQKYAGASRPPCLPSVLFSMDASYRRAEQLVQREKFRWMKILAITHNQELNQTTDVTKLFSNWIYSNFTFAVTFSLHGSNYQDTKILYQAFRTKSTRQQDEHCPVFVMHSLP